MARASIFWWNIIPECDRIFFDKNVIFLNLFEHQVSLYLQKEHDYGYNFAQEVARYGVFRDG